MKKLLIIGFVWPEPNSTAAGSRMMQLISIFQKEKYDITFVSTATKNPNSFDLESIDITTNEIELNNSSFDSFIKELNPNVVLFDRFLTEEQFGWRVAENCPNALRILDTEDLHFLRKARQIALKNKFKISLELLMNDLAKREVASIYRCDITLIISKYESKLLRKTFKINKYLLIYIPFLVEPIDTVVFKNYSSFKERSHFITMGNFKHEPNWNAVQYLKSEIWPLIRSKLPNAEMHVYGAYATEKVLQLNKPSEGFIIKGWAKNKEEAYCKHRVSLAPLLFGAGLKGKLIDAMVYGTPSITTSIGAEAMHKKLPWNGFICDDPKEFTAKAVELYQNDVIWKQAQENGVTIIEECYSKKKYGDKFIRKVSKIQQNLQTHRLQNFTGELLQFHTLRSTKYLAKWIEEKNK